jgi:cysteine desulfurase
MIKFPIYLDYHSTTPVDTEVLEEMLPYFTENFGNAASKSHRYGWIAAEAVNIARNKIAKLINSSIYEIFFTSGATESINLALKGIAEAYIDKGNHIITTHIEHKAVLDTCKYLEERGFEISFLDVDEYGIVNAESLNKLITEKTILVSVIFANNEIGTIQPIGKIQEICGKKNVLLFTDATQAAGKIPIDSRELKIDLMCFSSHKIYGPKGIGALYIKDVKPKIKVIEQINGGGHERGLRSGTLNVPAIVGFGKACEIAMNNMKSDEERIRALRDKLQNELLVNLPFAELNGHPEKRLYNNLNISFGNIDSNVLISSLKDIAVSTGSACSSESAETSYVLKAIGKTAEKVKSSIRIGLGRYNTEEEIKYAAEKIISSVKRLNNIS